ncbi:MAG: UDP-N-acetylmuramoyl-L-alanine--D-glutamate ligase [Oscillospiraceae bacterium]|jgi:UDP-N-acetylmuramoylalanine--D-glutamate ligase|nr:UDP-N-acetylmuramoyl-L-alanine--D-glutamate ligase [Oscillospiraceae bacterium]
MPHNSADALRAYLKDKRILLLGFGREGRSSYRFLRGLFPTKTLGIADAKPVDAPDANCTLHTGADYLGVLAAYDLVLKSPGIPFVGVDVPETCAISGQIDLFLRFAPCTIVGVTGTKGKTTTATLLYDMLRASGVPAILAGNMGLPVLDEWAALAESPTPIFVLELSCHQLEHAHASPHVAVWTNLYPEHLDHYQTGFSGYLNAKRQIFRHQQPGDFLVTSSAQDITQFFGTLRPAGALVTVEPPDTLPYPVSERLPGRHNLLDVALAAAAARLVGATDEGIRQAAADFKGVAHRMEPLGIFGGLDFVDDCIATVPAATLAALDALPLCRTLIFGGQDRGIDYLPFCGALANTALRTLIALPDTGHTLVPTLRELCADKQVIVAADMEEAVAAAFAHTNAGESVLLSPAAPSYNVYADFEAKAAHFQALIRAYAV